MIGIIGAMDSEVASLCDKLENAEQLFIGNLEFHKGKLNGKDAVIVKSGIGKVNAALCAQTLIIKFNVSCIINTGIAGATGGKLSIFDFVVSEEAVYHDVDTTAFGYKIGQLPGMPETFKADAKLVEKAITAFHSTEYAKEHKIVAGRIASGDQFISAGDKKKFIKDNFNPLCVEMEGSAIAHTCTLYKTPFIIVRCMSDMADETVESTYSFNEDVCAKMCADFVTEIIKAF